MIATLNFQQQNTRINVLNAFQDLVSFNQITTQPSLL